MWRTLSLWLCLAVALVPAPGAGEISGPRPHVEIRGLYGGVPHEILDSGRGLKEFGVNAVWLGSGSFTPERMAVLRAQGVRVFAEFNTLHVARYLEEHPDAAPIGPDGQVSPPPDGWQGICPTHEAYRASRMAAFRRLLEDFAVDGVWLDYHHGHASWEQAEPNMPDTCFCPRCLRRFAADTGTTLPEGPTSEISALLLSALEEKWVRWRCSVLTDWVREFRSIIDETRPGALLGTFHNPWTDEERDGARIRKLAIDLEAQAAYVDIFSPMPYHARFGHAGDPEWISRQVAWLGTTLGIEGTPGERHRIWPIVQVSDWGGAVPLAQVSEVLDQGSRPPATGVMVFAWGSLRKQPEKVEAVGEAFRALRPPPATGNRPERLEWFRDLGFGLFIHWSLDSQVGAVISHSMVGASDDYLERYLTELPRSFNPSRFDPAEWARLARLAGVTYVVFTAKHHSGFCMFETATTDFSIMNTPFGRDATRELVDAFRAEGLAIGLYFSPDDFHFLHRQGTLISRRRPEAQPVHNPALLAHDQAQIRELMTQYGPIDMVFIDGPPEGLREVVWESDPDTLVTRGAMETPEQYTPGVPLEGAWEGNLTMGSQWQYRGTHETYKSGTELIETLVETRAKGGNLLLNIGPRPDGMIPVEQEARLQEMALWNLINREAILAVRPWVVTHEGEVWFTKAQDADTVYAIVTGTDWPWGTTKTFTLVSVEATGQTEVSVLGQNDQVLEYRPEVVPRTTFEATAEGLRVTAWRAQRLYNDRRWPNPVVLKLTNVRPGLEPPVVVTLEGRWDAPVGTATLAARLDSLGDAHTVQVGFEYRRKKGAAEMYEEDDPWVPLGQSPRSSPGRFTSTLSDIDAHQDYEFRAVVHHPKMEFRGQRATLDHAP